jgi:hypothetical protein
VLPVYEIESLLSRSPGDLQDIVLELRNIITSVASDATEVVRWGGLSYFFKEKGGIMSAGICQIEIKPDHIRLSVIHGAFIPDPDHLFRGYQKFKRFVRIDSYDTAPWEALKVLIKDASHFNPRTLKNNS